MPRKKELTEIQIKENRKKIESERVNISFKVDLVFLDKLDKFGKRYVSRNACIRDLIKTHPEFKQFQLQNQNKSNLKTN